MKLEFTEKNYNSFVLQNLNKEETCSVCYATKSCTASAVSTEVNPIVLDIDVSGQKICIR